jgi:two-component system, NarL family, response regulator NreC
MIKILIVDDHELFREGIASLLRTNENIEILNTFGNSQETLRFLEKYTPDIILMDIGLRNEDGIDITKRILEKYPEIKVIILSMYSSYEYAIRAFDVGVKGYLLKECASDELVNAIFSVMDSEEYVSDSISKVLSGAHIQYLKDKDKYNDLLLSDREREVLKYLAEGVTSKEIAAELKVSSKTIDGHKIKIMSKMGFKNLADLIKYAIRHGIVS